MEMNSQIKGKHKKSALGRGLGSLLGADSESTSGEMVKPNQMAARVWQVAIDKLVANKNQPRKVFEREAIRSLSESIRQKGILQPIVARRLSRDQFEIIAGERRWRAAQAAGFHEVPVILKETDEQNTLELALIENIQREDLNAIEEAEAYRFLIDQYELTQQELAIRVGKDRASIANTMRLLNLSSSVKNMVSESQLSRGQAKLLVTISDERLQLKIAKKIVSEKMSVREAEKFINKISKINQKDSELTDDSDVSQKFVKNLSEELQKMLGTKVKIDYKKGRGQLSIYYYSEEEFNQLVDRLRKT